MKDNLEYIEHKVATNSIILESVLQILFERDILNREYFNEIVQINVDKIRKEHEDAKRNIKFQSFDEPGEA